MWKLVKVLVCVVVVFVLSSYAYKEVHEDFVRAEKQTIKELKHDVAVRNQIIALLPMTDKEKKGLTIQIQKTYSSDPNEIRKVLGIKKEEIKEKEDKANTNDPNSTK